MYESEVVHLYPSIKNCFVCNKKLEGWYRTERSIKTLDGKIDIVCHKFRCGDKRCSNYDKVINPEEENRLALKSKNIGLDVILEIGRLRYKEHKTWEEIRLKLHVDYNLKISERTVGHQVKDYLALINVVAKQDNKLLLSLKNLKGIIIAIDGIKPDNGDEQLFLIREIQTGQILSSRLISYTRQEEIEHMIQEVMDLGFPILGIISDKDCMQKKALENKLPYIPHQICQYHFLKRLVHPLKKADTKLKKKINSSLLELRKMENELFKEKSGSKIKIARDYFLAIKTSLKIKSNYPLKPGGIKLYNNLVKIKESIESCFVCAENTTLFIIYTFVYNTIIFCQKEYQQLETAYSWIYTIASLLKATNETEVKAKNRLHNYVESIPIQEDVDLEYFRNYIERRTISWLPGIFRYLSFSYLPKTNNKLEQFNCYIKRTYRKITGRKNAQLFLTNNGAFVAFLLGMESKSNLHSIFTNISYDDFINARNELANKIIRSKIFTIQRYLQDYLFELEIQWTSQ